MPEPDEGRHVDRCYNVREALGDLYRKRQLDLDYWVCKFCFYPNHPSSPLCRGALDIRYARWVREGKDYVSELRRLKNY